MQTCQPHKYRPLGSELTFNESLCDLSNLICEDQTRPRNITVHPVLLSVLFLNDTPPLQKLQLTPINMTLTVVFKSITTFAGTVNENQKIKSNYEHFPRCTVKVKARLGGDNNNNLGQVINLFGSARVWEPNSEWILLMDFAFLDCALS
jgi:hypothetical protein